MYRLNKTSEVILTVMNLREEKDVQSYLNLSNKAIPEPDIRFQQVDEMSVGYRRIVLFDGGRRLCVQQRGNFRTMVILNDDEIQIVPLRGSDFQRIGVEEKVQDDGEEVEEE